MNTRSTPTLASAFAVISLISMGLGIASCDSATSSTTDPTTGAGGSGGSYNALWIPPTLSGTDFALTLGPSSKQFRSGATTTTYAFNGAGFWGPTLIMNKGDSVQMRVTNALSEATTTHWHGFHIAPEMDGGPHQTIAPGATWSPAFVVRNNAATYWYHPHLHEKTYEQLTMGAGGFIIIRDPAEAALSLPRTYGTDDIPLVFSSRRFLGNNQFSKNINLDVYGDYMLTNGTLQAQVTLPKQSVRLRMLNAEIERGLNIGFSDNRSFSVITNDGGLLNAPVSVTRVVLLPGERVEIVVNLAGDALGASLDLKAYNAGREFGFPGSEGNPVTPTGNAGPAFGSLLNNTNFDLLHITVGAPTATPVTAISTTLANNRYWTAGDVTNRRTITITGGQPAAQTVWSFDNKAFSHAVINQTVKLGAVEQWTITNNNIFGHSIHLHDVQFKILSRSSGQVAPYESGWKDTFYIPVNSSVVVLAKFEDFASLTHPYMYHCHFSNHEDEGLMGQFLVVP